MRKSKQPRFSIVIPCYNEADFLENTLNSLQDQSIDKPFEIIVVDNNCTDETVAVAKRCGVKVVSESKAGVCFARQAGTQVAEGEIIISTDADTVHADNWLERIDNEFGFSDDTVAVGGPCRYYDGPWWGKVYTHFLFTASYLYSLISGRPFYVTATNLAFKKSAWDGYDTTCIQAGDEIGLLHQLTRKGKVKFLNTNPVYTSGRRLKKGLIYNVFMTFLFYYMAGYYVNRMFKRTIIGAAPAFRPKNNLKPRASFNARLASTLLMMTILFTAVSPIRDFVSDGLVDTAAYVRVFWHIID